MMNDLEEIWEQCFSQLGYKLDLVKPNYQEMEHDDRMIASLYWLELEMYNGGLFNFSVIGVMMLIYLQLKV